MLSVLRWFIGCWHDWDKWKFMPAMVDGVERPTMQRACKKCGEHQAKLRICSE